MISDVTILDAVPEDVTGILTVRRVTWLATYPNIKFGILYQDIKNSLDKRDIGAIEKWQIRIKEDVYSHTWVANTQSHIVGFISAGKADNHHCIKALYILPDYQHAGIGKELMGRALKWLGNNLKITLEVVSYNSKAINFYRKFGFVENGPTICEVGELPNGKHLPEIEMIKNIS
jgi:ribosomal protein S18 acetylase RimI-like enzyme